eukprot:6007264-Amphidinium_carterae.1
MGGFSVGLAEVGLEMNLGKCEVIPYDGGLRRELGGFMWCKWFASGDCDLGSPIGSMDYALKYADGKVQDSAPL